MDVNNFSDFVKHLNSLKQHEKAIKEFTDVLNNAYHELGYINEMLTKYIDVGYSIDKTVAYFVEQKTMKNDKARWDAVWELNRCQGELNLANSTIAKQEKQIASLNKQLKKFSEKSNMSDESGK